MTTTIHQKLLELHAGYQKISACKVHDSMKVVTGILNADSSPELQHLINDFELDMYGAHISSKPDSKGVYFGCSFNQNLVGYSHILSGAVKNAAYMPEIYLILPVRNSGFSDYLMKTMVLEVHKTGLLRIVVDCPLSRKKAKRFYERNGFDRGNINQKENTVGYTLDMDGLNPARDLAQLRFKDNIGSIL
jgi:hypothetical protein